MKAAIDTRPNRTSDRTRHRTPYDLDMAKRVIVGIQELRLRIKWVVAQVTGGPAGDGTTEPGGKHVIFTRHGKALGAFVPMDWYRAKVEEDGEPTDL